MPVPNLAGSRLENLTFDRSSCRLSFHSLRNCFVICQRSLCWLFVCFSGFVVPALLLKCLLLDPFATLLDLLRHHSLSQFQNPSRSAQSHLSLLLVATDDHPNCLAQGHHELLLVPSSSLSSLVLETRPFWVGFRWSCSPGLTVALLNISALPLNVSLHPSMTIRLVAVWNASHHFGPDATLRRQQQVFLVHTAYPDRLHPSTVQLACSHLVSACNLRHDHLSKWHQR